MPVQGKQSTERTAQKVEKPDDQVMLAVFIPRRLRKEVRGFAEANGFPMYRLVGKVLADFMDAHKVAGTETGKKEDDKAV